MEGEPLALQGLCPAAPSRLPLQPGGSQGNHTIKQLLDKVSRAGGSQPQEVKETQPVGQTEDFPGSDSDVWMPREMAPNLPRPPIPPPGQNLGDFSYPSRAIRSLVTR